MLNKFNYEYYSHPSSDAMLPVGRTPESIDYIAFYICEHGDAEVMIDGKDIALTSNSLCVVLPCTIVGIEKYSQNLKGFGAKASILFIDELFIPNIGDYYTYIKNSPCITITKAQLSTIKKLTEIINQKIDGSNTPLTSLVVKNLLNSLVYEIISCYANNATEMISSRQDVIFREFMQHVFRDHKTERTLEYYAGKMCITTRYLSATVKEKTGYTATYWIDSMVTAEAKNLLRTTDLSVQQIAQEMNFANASFFGQYFRKHAGITPLRYRNGG